MQLHPLEKIGWANLVRCGRNLGKIKAKFGQKRSDLGKIKVLHSQKHSISYVYAYEQKENAF